MYRQFDMDWLMRQSDDTVIKELHRHPAHFWLLEQSVIAQAAGRISIGWGMTPDTAFIPLGDDMVDRFVYLFGRANRREIKTWNGLDLRHMNYHVHEGQQSYGTMDLLAGLWAGRDWLTQDILDFITLRDVKGSQLGVLLKPGPGMAVGDEMPSPATLDDFFLTEEEIQLSNAFSLQMANEAQPHRHQVAAGYYVLDRVPLPAVDEVILYHHLRLVLSPKGIYASLVFEHESGAGVYFPFYWTAPEPQINTAQVLVPGKGLFAIDQMMACIWRDACVVREAWASERRGVKGATRSGKAENRDNPMILPRTVYRSAWGSAEDRAVIEERTRSAHSVRACYPRLVEGFTPRKASERAAEYGYPPPPPGYTFRRPHTRGAGEVEARARKVVCRGLFVAKIMLGA